MEEYRNNQNIGFILTCFLFFWGIIILLFQLEFEEASFDILISFAINGLFYYCLMMNELKKRSYSIELIFWIFMFFFMFFAPLIQYANNTYPWSSYLGTLDDAEIIRNNILLLTFTIAFVVGKRVPQITFKISRTSRSYENDEKENWFVNFLTSRFEASSVYCLVFLIISIGLTIYALRDGGISAIFVSRSESGDRFYSGNNQTISLIVSSILPSFLTFSTVYAINLAKEEKKYTVIAFAQFLCLLCCYFPTTTARYKAATIYIGILLVMFNRLNKGTRFFWVFVSGLFIVFPLLNIFRYSFDVSSITAFFETFGSTFFDDYTEGHYDAYRMLSSTVDYVHQNGITFGKQLLGVLFFFIPRSIWKNKPIGSGATIVEDVSSGSFSNVSCPFMAEGYINFGIIGLILFAIVFGYIVRRLDDFFYIKMISSSQYESMYIFLIPLFFFLLRGDLLSSFAYMMGFIVVAYIMQKIVGNI